MSLNISLYDSEQGLMSMNWNRNPFGLCTWAETNYNYRTESVLPDDQNLWYVVNHWNYDKSKDVDRQLFLEVVLRYALVLAELEQGYFFFTEAGLKQFIWPCIGVTAMLDVRAANPPYVTVGHKDDKHRMIGIPMGQFADPCFGLSDTHRPNAHTLEHYKEWFAELIRFAIALQNLTYEFYCRN